MDRRCFKKATVDSLILLVVLMPIYTIIYSRQYNGIELFMKSTIDAFIFCLGGHLGFCCGFTFKQLIDKLWILGLSLMSITIICCIASYLITQSVYTGILIAFSLKLAFISKVFRGRTFRNETDQEDDVE